MSDRELYDRGMAVRREVLGDEYVDRVIAESDDLSRPLQEFVTEWCWGGIWGREGLDRRTRSLVNLAMITALNRPHELRVHLNGALRNGCTREEIQEVLLQATAYCGAPAGVDAFQVAREVLGEDAAAER